MGNDKKAPVTREEILPGGSEQRRFPRFQVNFNMKVKGVGDLTGIVDDMSINGCRVIISGEDLPIADIERKIGDTLVLTFMVDDKQVEECPALFRRIISENVSELALAFEFKDLPQKLLGKIFEIVFNYEK